MPSRRHTLDINDNTCISFQAYSITINIIVCKDQRENLQIIDNVTFNNISVVS